MNEIETLKRRIDELEKFVKQLQMSSSIPLPVDQAFRERFLGKTGAVTGVGDGGTVNTSSFNSFDVLVPVVSGKFKLRINGTDYNFLYQ